MTDETKITEKLLVRTPNGRVQLHKVGIADTMARKGKGQIFLLPPDELVSEALEPATKEENTDAD